MESPPSVKWRIWTLLPPLPHLSFLSFQLTQWQFPGCPTTWAPTTRKSTFQWRKPNPNRLKWWCSDQLLVWAASHSGLEQTDWLLFTCSEALLQTRSGSVCVYLIKILLIKCFCFCMFPVETFDDRFIVSDIYYNETLICLTHKDELLFLIKPEPTSQVAVYTHVCQKRLKRTNDLSDWPTPTLRFKDMSLFPLRRRMNSFSEKLK